MEYLSHWIVQAFAVILGTLLVAGVQKLIMTRIHRRLEKTHNLWDDAIVGAMQLPLSVFILVMGVSFAAQLVQVQAADTALFDLIPAARHVATVSIIAWFLLRLVKHTEANVIAAGHRKGKPVDKTTAEAVSKILRFSIIITSSLVMLQTLGVSISGVLAFGGIGGIAIGFAAKDLLANFFGGFMIFWDRPFKVGDWISSPDRQIEGTVEQIGWRLTRIRKFDKRPIYVPNAVFTTVTLENPSRMTNRRIFETIGLRYDDVAKVAPILEEIRTYLKTHVEIDTKQTLMVHFNEFGASSLDFFIYTFTKTTAWVRFHEIKEEILLGVHNIIANHGAEVAFPTTTIQMAGEEPMLIPEAKSGKPHPRQSASYT